MPPSPSLRFSPGRELRGENHKRGHSFESGLLLREKDDDLTLFNEMQTKERENFLLQSSDDFDDAFSTKLRHFSNIKLGISIPTRGESSELLNADGEKTDYDWLLTPPDTPLFPSLDDEPPTVNHARRGRPRSQPISISRSSTMDKSYRSSRGSASPNRLSPSPRSGNNVLQSRGRPSSAPHTSPPPTLCPATPTRRPSPPPSKTSIPARRSSTPTPRRMSTGSSGSVASSGVRGTSPVRTARGNSASPKIRAWQSNIPGFSLDAPPNLRTTLGDRPASYVRGSSPASRNGRDSNFRRQSMSPTASRSVSSSHSQDRDRFSSQSKGSVASSGDDDVDSLQSVPLGGLSRSVPKRTGAFPSHRTPMFNKKSARVLSPSSVPKRSFDSTIRQMEQRKNPPNMFRPLLSSVPSTTFYSGKGSAGHRSMISRNSSVTTSSNASSDLGTSVAHDTEGSDQHQDDLASECGKVPGTDVQEVFAFDKMDTFNQDNRHERHYSAQNNLIDEFDGDHAIECDPSHLEELSHQRIEAEMSSSYDALCDQGEYSEVDSLQKTRICSVCSSRYQVIEIAEENTSVCPDCIRLQNFKGVPISEAVVLSSENSPMLSIKIAEKSEPLDEMECSAAVPASLLQVSGEAEYRPQNEENLKQDENFYQENSMERSLVEGTELRSSHQQETTQPSPGHSLLDSDGKGQQLETPNDPPLSKVESLELAGISVLLRRTSSNKGPVVQGRTFIASSLPYEDLSYAKDSSYSLRSSIGHGSISASSSVDFSSSRPTETRVQRQSSGKKSDVETFRYEMIARPQSSGLSLSRSSSNSYQSLCHPASTHEINLEVTVDSLKSDRAETSGISIEKECNAENKANSTDLCLPVASVSQEDTFESDESSRGMEPLTAELSSLQLDNSLATPVGSYEDCVLNEKGEDTQNNGGSVSGGEASSFITLESTDEKHSKFDTSLDDGDVVEVPVHSSLTPISEAEGENSCQSSPCSEVNGVTPNSEGNRNEIEELSVTSPSGINTTLVQESTVGDILEESTVLVEGAGGNKAKSLTLEEATDTILFCSSIVHDLAYQAANIAIEKESSVPLEESRPTVTILGKVNSDRRESHGRNSSRRPPKIQKARQRRIEKDAKSPSPVAENDENTDESSIRNVGLPDKVDSMKPPKLESKCNCTIM